MRRIAEFVVAGTVLGAVLSVLFIEGVDWFPKEGSTQASNEYPLFIALTYVSFVIFAVVMVAMCYSLWKFRRHGPVRPARRRSDARQHGARDRLDDRAA